MPESMWSQSGEGSDITPADWIKNNMFGDTYTANMGRKLTEAEVRFQKCLEQLPVPSWYLTYSKKKPSIRLNCIPFDKRQSTWKNVKAPVDNSQKKSPKKRSPKCSPNTSDSESPVHSRADSGFNETYRISRRTPRINKSPCISITSSDEDDEPVTPTLTDYDKTLAAVELSLNRTPRNPSNTFPRVTPSRKVENLNIVFERPFPPRDDKLELDSTLTEPHPLYTNKKNVEVWSSDSSTEEGDKTHTTFLIADVDDGGIHPLIHVSAGVANSSSEEDEEDEEPRKLIEDSTPLKPRLPSRCSPSPNTRFFTSRKKSTALEKIVQGNLGNPRGNLVQDIIGELEQSTTSSSNDDFMRSMVSALEESFAGDTDQYQEDLDGELESDSELARSVDISIKSSGGEESADEQPTTPLPRLPSPQPSEPTEPEEEVYWIPTWMSKLPRTSSRLSMFSRASGRFSNGTVGRNSPGLSPISRECPEDWFVHPTRAWGYTYSARKNRSPRSLFRIDESVNFDSGYSDTATSRRTVPSRTGTIGSTNTGCHDRYTPNATLVCEATLVQHDSSNDTLLNKSGPYVLKSFLV